MAGVFEILTPHSPHRPVSVRGEDTLAGWGGGGGDQYFGRRQTQLRTLFKYFVQSVFRIRIRTRIVSCLS
jgi:hypothetical protein